MRMSYPKLITGLLTACVMAVGAGCSSTSTPESAASPATAPATSPSTASSAPVPSSEPIPVVASTNVWGDVVSAVGGDHVKVTSIISNPDADPHSYEANATTALELSRAVVVIENGGGYDDFVDTMLTSSKNTGVTKLNAVDISGKKAAAGAELNEHVWYDFPTVAKVADQIALALGKADSANAATFTANAASFTATLTTLEKTEATIATTVKGKGAAITEPVPLYMLTACGIVNKTPPEFSEAIEAGTDVSPRVLQQTLDLFTQKQVGALVYNEQTSGAETEKVLAAAKAADVPVIPVRETLPAGKDYLTWMGDNLTAIQNAYGK